MNPNKLLDNRIAILVTKHGKEKVISPLLHESFGLQIKVGKKVDTDEFGTFCGEIERPDTQYNTARLKIEKAFELYPDAEIAIASEGSFNPHPDCPFITMNTEIVLLKDKRNNLEIFGRYLSFATYIKQATISSIEEAKKIAETIGFPEYGIILKAGKNQNNMPYIIKDIRTESSMEAALLFLFSASGDGKVDMQSDMRAHYNPIRMENIRMATLDLIKNIQTRCPSCDTPGFDVTDAIKGLPCVQCHLPTNHILAYVRLCQKCGYSEKEQFPNEKKFADAMFCDYCNP